MTATTSPRIDGATAGRTPLYLPLTPDPAFFFLHPAQSSGTAVLLCPPFGWDDVCSYRSRAAWAEDLAARGHPVLRLDLPGSGDSGGTPRGAGRLDAWTDSVRAAVTWLRSHPGVARVAVLGIGLGGIVAVRALADGAAIDDLVLWAVPARGRALVRELEVFARLEIEWSGETPPANDADGLIAGGFALSDETLASLRALDLTKLKLPDLSGSRVLLLERDGLAPDARLHAALQAVGAAVEVAPGDGYGRMMDDPRWAKPPRSVFARVGPWLGGAALPVDGSVPPLSLAGPDVEVAETVELTVDGERIRETPMLLDVGGPSLFGVLAEPVNRPRVDLCAVLLNAGPVRRIGPNRTWVEASRRWAALGVPTVRFDMYGVGDSDGDDSRFPSDNSYFAPDLIDYTVRLLDELQRRDLPPNFFLAGLCSGAYWSFGAALRDRRIRGAYLINLPWFFWSRSLFLDREFKRARLLVHKRQNLRWAAAMLGIGLLRRPGLPVRVRRRRRQIEAALAQLADRDTQLTFGFGADEPLLADLVAGPLAAQLEATPGFSLERFDTADHTLRALAYQRQLHARLDAALMRAMPH